MLAQFVDEDADPVVHKTIPYIAKHLQDTIPLETGIDWTVVLITVQLMGVPSN